MLSSSSMLEGGTGPYLHIVSRAQEHASLFVSTVKQNSPSMPL